MYYSYMLIIFIDYFKTDKHKLLLDLDNKAFNAVAQPDHSALYTCNQTFGALKTHAYICNYKIDRLDAFPEIINVLFCIPNKSTFKMLISSIMSKIYAGIMLYAFHSQSLLC